MNTNNTTKKTKNIILETYEFAPRIVRIKDEDELLFQVYPSVDYKRSKKDADEIAKHIVKAVNSHSMLLDALKDAINRMDRARNILTNGNATMQNNWMMLQSDNLKTALNKAENI